MRKGNNMSGIDDWLESAYEDRNGGDLDLDGGDEDADEMFQDFHDDE